MKFHWNEQTFQWFEEASAFTQYDRKLSELLLPYLKDCRTICDIGCGMALVDFELAAYFDAITCVDISPETIRYIRDRAARKNIRNIHACCADGMQMAAESVKKWDVVMALFHGTVDRIGTKYLSFAKKKLILMVHGNIMGSTGPEQYRVRKCCDTDHTKAWLSEHGFTYQFRSAELEFGQPHKTMEDAVAYLKTFTVNAPEDELIVYAKEHVIETGRTDFPFYTPKKRQFGIFIIEKEL